MVALILAIVAATSAAASEQQQQQHRNNMTVAAYLPEWRYEGANWVDISATTTQLILFSLEVTPIGRLAAFDRLPRKELMLQAREATKAAGTKLLVCIGGNGRSAGFTGAVANKERRQKFVDSLVDLCDKHDLDGIDLNWEYPGYDFKTGYASDDVLLRDYKGLKRLLKLLHAAFEPSGRIITLAYYPDKRQEGLIKDHGFGKYVANMHMMSYDQQGKHSTWEFAERVAKQGAQILPAHLVTLGVPFYGRHTQTGDWKSWEDLVQMFDPLGDGVDESGGYYFNSAALIRRKTRLAHAAGLGGVMIWEVGQDCRRHAVTHGETTHAVTCPRGEDSSLLAAMQRELDVLPPRPPLVDVGAGGGGGGGAGAARDEL